MRSTLHELVRRFAALRLIRSAVLGSAMVAVLLVSASARALETRVAQTQSFDDGVEAYRSGDYGAARELFHAALVDRSADRADTLHNLGNVAFRQQRPLEAAAYYTAALREAPRRQDTWWNLEFVRREAGLDPADRGDLRDTAARLATMLTLPEAETLVLALLGALAVALAWEAVRGGLVAKATAWSLAGVAAVALVPYGVQLSRSSDDPVFVVQPEGAALTSEPREASAVIGRLAPASIVEYVDELPGWERVRTPAGEVGWVRDASVIDLRLPR